MAFEHLTIVLDDNTVDDGAVWGKVAEQRRIGGHLTDPADEQLGRRWL